jgi:aminoglycoside phosphotransferase (APT) family kinase protein
VKELKIDELLDRATLAADSRWPDAAVTDIEPLPGGISSLTFAARVRAPEEVDRLVIKVAPPGLRPVRNRDVLRQAQVLRALHGKPGVSVPEVLLADSGDPQFFIMEFVEGEAYEPHKDLAQSPPSPDVVASRARAAARMLARMHKLEPGQVGLAAEPAIPLVEELERWGRLFATADDDMRHNETELYAQLAASVPDAVTAKILHGDYRLGNMQFEGERLSAIIDWEIWSVGDPRTDLAWLLAYTDPVLRFVERRDPANQRAADAMPDRDDLLHEYLTTRDVEIGDLSWFLAYCQYKMASTTSVLAKQNRRRTQPDPGLEIAASTLPSVIDRGLKTLEMSWSPRP